MYQIKATIFWISLMPLLIGCGDDEAKSNCPASASAQLDRAKAPAIVTGSWFVPDIDATWQWQLKDNVNTEYDVDIYDVDLFDNGADFITDLQSDGRKVMCYFSAGSAEDWRDDYSDYDETDLGKPLDGWAGEVWVDIRSANVATILEARLDLAAEKGRDLVEPDNMDGFIQDSCFNLSANDQLKFNRWLANAAHERGLGIALKNDGDQAEELEPYFDLSVNEECHQYEECEQLSSFTDAGKAIFNAEYNDSYVGNTSNREALCTAANEASIQTLVLPLDLDDSFRYSCF